MVETSQRVSNHFERFGFLTNTNNLTRLHTVGCNADNLTIHHNVLVVHQLTSSGTSGRDSETEDNVVKTALKALEENLTGNAAGRGSLFKHVAELLLKNTVSVLCLLLFCKHDAVLRSFATTRIAMLTGRVVTLGQNLVCTENSLAESTGNARLRTNISCHFL